MKLRAVRQGERPGLLRRVQRHHLDPYKREAGRSEAGPGGGAGQRGHSAALRRRRKGPQAKGRRWPLESGEAGAGILAWSLQTEQGLLTRLLAE